MGIPVFKYPELKNIVQTAASGKETRLALWTNPIWHFELPFNYLKDDASRTGSNTYSDYRTMVGAFLQRQGTFDTFLYDDADDDTVVNQNFGTGDGSTVTFQLVRDFGGFLEWIQNLNGAPTIKDNGSTVPPANYSVSSTGQITFTTAPLTGHALTWGGSFYYRCRFEENSWNDMQKYLIATKVWQVKTALKVKFVSVKL